MLLRWYRKCIANGGMLVLGVLTVIIRYASFGYGVALNRRVVTPALSRLFLLLCGIRVRRLGPLAAGEGSVCYFFNHNSNLDIFLIPVLGLPNTRAIITEGIKSILPLHLCNLGIDVLYIPDSHKTQERIAFFQRVSADLRAGKYSVICSPEGRHEFKRGIAPMNRGVFHMAMAGECPVQLLYFDIPEECDPLEGVDLRSGQVTVRSLGMVETTDWTVERLPDQIDGIRQRYLAAFRAANPEARCK
jgi:putative phosphoserine phosphatase/1-acylglycerol-3-phosphate O-acyltransferase